jgi:hypothetical protein
MEVISGIRTIRKDKNIVLRRHRIKSINRNSSTYFDSVVIKLGNHWNVSEKVDSALSYRVN